VELLLFPGSEETALEFYEDDGVSFAWQSGEYALTRVRLARDESGIRVHLGPTEGRYAGQPSDRRWDLTIAVERAPAAVMADGRQLPASAYEFDGVMKLLRVKGCANPAEFRVQLPRS
jgi:hypothetical protein